MTTALPDRLSCCIEWPCPGWSACSVQSHSKRKVPNGLYIQTGGGGGKEGQVVRRFWAPTHECTGLLGGGEGWGGRSVSALPPLRPCRPAGTLRAGRRPASHTKPLTEVSVLMGGGERSQQPTALPPRSRSCGVQPSLRHRPSAVSRAEYEASVMLLLTETAASLHQRAPKPQSCKLHRKVPVRQEAFSCPQKDRDFDFYWKLPAMSQSHKPTAFY